MPARLAASDDQVVLGKFDPQSQAAGTVDLWIDASKAEVIQFIISVGTMTASGTLDAQIYQATDNSGTGAKALSPTRALAQVTQAGSGSNKVYILNVRASEIDANNGFKFVSPHIVIGTAASILGVVALGATPQSTPPTSIATQVLQ